MYLRQDPKLLSVHIVAECLQMSQMQQRLSVQCPNCVTQSPGKHKHLPNEVCTSKTTVVCAVSGDVLVEF